MGPGRANCGKTQRHLRSNPKGSLIGIADSANLAYTTYPNVIVHTGLSAERELGSRSLIRSGQNPP